MTREEIREHTMQIIFQMDVANDFDYEKLLPIEENRKTINKKQAINTLEAIKNNITEIDKVIEKHIDNWTIDRIGKTDLAILRNAVAEIFYLDEIPVAVSINEAVNLAKKYGDDKSFAFINSVLSKISKSIKVE